ncbi:MAG: hypothetical protein AAF215_00165 [Cyanobacteria bacterium P01_A01_bin.123]
MSDFPELKAQSFPLQARKTLRPYPSFQSDGFYVVSMAVVFPIASVHPANFFHNLLRIFRTEHLMTAIKEW